MLVEITKELKGNITEAFSENKLQKVSELLASLFSKLDFGKFGPIYKGWFKNEFKSSDGEKGVGYLFVSNKGYMIRFSYVNSNEFKGKLKDKFYINRVDFWVPGNSKIEIPTETIDLAPWFNIVESVKTIGDILKGIKVESKNRIEESRPKVPIKMMRYMEAKGYKYEGETWTQCIKKLGSDWDEDEYKGYKVKKGSVETNSITKDIEKGESLLAKKPLADPDKIFKDIEKGVGVLASGLIPMNGVIIVGEAGIGKTFGVEKKLKDMFGEFNEPNSKVRFIKGGKLSTFGVYKLLYQNRDDKIIVFDDTDDILKDSAVVGMLKSAMDTYPEREISWESNLTMPMSMLSKDERTEYFTKIDNALSDPSQAGKVGGKIKMPASFPFTSKVIFISNMSFSKFTKDPHLNAIYSRSMHFNVEMMREDIINRIRSIMQYIMPDVSMDVKEKVLNELAKGNGKVSIRAFEFALGFYLSPEIGDDWKEWVQKYV